MTVIIMLIIFPIILNEEVCFMNEHFTRTEAVYNSISQANIEMMSI